MKYAVTTIIVAILFWAVIALTMPFLSIRKGAIDYRTGRVGLVIWNLANATTADPCSRQPVYRASGADVPAPAELPAAPYPICP